VLYNLAESVRIATVLLKPFMPDTAEKIFSQIGAAAEVQSWDSAAIWGALNADAALVKGETLFPRIDAAKELEYLESLNAPKEEEAPIAPPITFDDFVKVEMTVCKVISCENVKKSEKLLKFQLDDGSGTPRQILSGIAKYYKAEDLVGKTLVACTNLAPRKMMGQESCGMLLSAEQDDKLNLLILDDAIKAGANLC